MNALIGGMRMSYKLIINADDFGISSSVNRAIVYAFSNNMITNTTLMVNMPYADEAVELEGKWIFR